MVNIELLRDIPFFQKFTQEELENLAGLTSLAHYKKNQALIVEGEENDSLYFILEGQAQVLIKGEVVALLKNKGDLIGEMSIIKDSTCTATVIPLIDITVITMNIGNLTALPKSCVADIEKALYKNYSIILTEKIVLTNKKAVLFEETNKKLYEAQKDLRRANEVLEEKVKVRTHNLNERNLTLEGQNLELVASYAELKELNLQKEATLKRIDELRKIHLSDFEKLLSQLNLEQPSNLRLLDMLREKVVELDRFLQPLTDEYREEQVIKTKRVLLVEENPKYKVTGKLALGSTGVAFDILSDPSLTEKILSGPSYDVIFLSFEKRELLNRLHHHSPNAEIVLMVDDSIRSYVEFLKNHSYISTILSRDHADRPFLIKSMATTVRKLVTQDLFGVEKYLNWGCEVQELSVSHSDERGQVISQMNQYLKNLGVRNTVLTNINTVTEEILMNAIYDAPVDINGKSLFNHLSRSTKISLDGTPKPLVRFACDGMNVAISVTDYYGNLKLDLILSYLKSCYEGEAGRMNQKEGKGGAGRGLHQMVELSDLLIFNVEEKKRTEVIGLFSLGDLKEKELNHPSFHFFRQKALSSSSEDNHSKRV